MIKNDNNHSSSSSSSSSSSNPLVASRGDGQPRLPPGQSRGADDLS